MILSQIKQLFGASEIDSMTTKQIQRQVALNTLQAQKIALDKQETTSTIALTQADIRELVVKEGLTQEDLKQIKTGLSLDGVRKSGLATTKLLTAADVDQMLATLSCDAATKEHIRSLLVEKGVMEQTTKSAQLLSKALMFIKAHPILVGIALVATTATLAIDLLTTSTEEARKKAEESAKELDELQSDISSINSELETTGKKIDAILAKDTITLADEEELKKLQAQNDELERELRIKEALEKNAKKEASDDATEVFTSVPDNGFWKQRGTTVYYEETRGAGGVGKYQDVDRDRMQASLDYMEQIKEVNKEIRDLKKQQDSLDVNSSQFQLIQNQIDDKTELLTAVQNALGIYIQEFQNEDDNLVRGISEDTDLVLDKLNEIYEKYDFLMNYGEGTATTIDERLKDKFANGADVNDPGSFYLASTSDANREKSLWIDTLSDEDKKILVVADIDENASLDELKAYLNKAKEVVEYENPIEPVTITGSIKQIAAELEPQFSKLGELYRSIFYAEDKDGNKVFDANAIDNSMLENLRQTFLEIEEDLGITFDPQAIEDFNGVMADGDATAEEAQQAFNDLATAWFYSTGTLDNLNETTKGAIIQQLEQLGVTNAQEIVTDALIKKETEAAATKLFLAEAGKDLSDATAQEIAEVVAEQIALGNVTKAMAEYYMQKVLANASTIKTEEDRANLLGVAKAAEFTGGQIQLLIEMINLLNQAEALKSTDLDYSEELAARAEVIKRQLQAGFDNAELTIDDFMPNDDDIGDSAKDAADKYVEAFEKELATLDALKDRGRITEKQYLEQLRKLYEKYFKDRKEYIDEFEKYEKQYLDGMKSLYQSVFSTIISKYDDKIDAANKAKDAAIDALEEEKDATIEAIEAERDARLEALDNQIEALESQIKIKEKEIDAIQDANKAKQEEINLEKEKYELERLQNQRTNLVYRSGEGFVYEADQSAVRDQKQAVEDAEIEIRISAIEKEVAALEERREALEDQRDSIEEYYDKLLEQTEKNFEQLIKQTESYWDSMIAGMEDYKSRYEELADMESDAKAMADLEQLCSTLGITVDEVLNMSDAAFQSFRDGYTSVLADIYSGNDQMMKSFSDLTGIDMTALTGHLAETEEYINRMKELDLSDMGKAIESVGDVFGVVADSVGLATNSIIGGGSKEESGTSLVGAIDSTKTAADTTFGTAEDGTGLIGQTEQTKTNVEGITAAIGSGEEGAENSGNLIGSINDLGATVTEQIGDSGGSGATGKFENLVTPIAEADSYLSNIKTTLAALTEKTWTVKVEVEGGAGLSASFIGQLTGGGSADGTAHVEGTANVNGDWSVHQGGRSLVGELGQEIIVRNGKFFTVGDSGAEMVDIKPGDIIFNHKQTEEILKHGYVNSRGKSYANGTVGNGKYIPLSEIDPDKAKLFTSISSMIKTVGDNNGLLRSIHGEITKMHETVRNISTFNTSSSPSTTITIGDIHLHDVQSADTLAKTIVSRLPSMVMQEIHKR